MSFIQQTLGVARDVRGFDQENKALEDKQQAQQALQQYYQSGGTDNDALISGVMKSPDLAKNVLSGIGITEKRQEEQAAADIARLWQVRQQPEAFRGALAERVNAIMARGGNPSDTIDVGMLYEKDPQAAEQQLRGVAAALEAKGYKTGVFAEQVEAMTPYQQASTDLRRQELEMRKQEKMFETQMKVLEARARKETDDIKKQELELRTQELQQKIDDAKRARETASNEKVAGLESARSNLDNMLNTLSRVKNTDVDVIASATGPFDTMIPTLSRDTADFEELVQTLGSQAFLSQIPLIKGMGQLSNAEGEKLQAALQNFSLRQSPERLKENLAEAERLLMKARANIAKQYGAEETKPDTPAKQAEPALDDLLKQYGGGQ